MNFRFKSFDNSKQNILLCDIDECYICNKLKQTLAEIKEICNKTVCDYIQCSLNYNHSKDFECEKLLAIEQREESLYYKSYKK